MAQFSDVIKYYRGYRAIALVSILASSAFELLDLIVPYAIGQLLNVVSQAPVDGGVQRLVNQLATLLGMAATPSLTLAVLLGPFLWSP
jgi:ATP-binding cassette subfamily B protein